MKSFIFIFFSLLLLSANVSAVVVKSLSNPQLFGIQVEAGRQEFYARVDSVNSVSLQYYITASYRVTEMVIDMHGSPLQLRIYHAGFIDPKSEAARMKSKTGIQSIGIPEMGVPTPIKKGLDVVEGAHSAVLLKEYPVTTHAKTIEYQLSNEAELLDLYKKIRDGWLRIDSEAETQNTQTSSSSTTTGPTTTPPTTNTTTPPTTNEKRYPRLNGRLFVVSG